MSWSPFRCRGCEAREAEIGRLNARLDLLLGLNPNQSSVNPAPPEAAATPSADPTEHDQPTLTWEEEAEVALKRLAEKRGLPASEFADA